MDVREKIIAFIKIRGPVLPVQVSKEIKLDILMSSAYLSELVSNKKLKISYLKIGGSPLYYAQGQEAKLQNFTSNLHEKEKRIYELLSQKKILRDNELEPLSRATIRQIKDFAVPLQVNYQGNVEVFWKWHLLPTEEAEKEIKLILKGPEVAEEKPAVSQEKEEIKEIKKEPIEKEEKKEITEKKKEKIKKPQLQKPSNFINQVTDYFNKNKIEIIEKNELRKNSEIDFIIKVPSSVGDLTYFCKAKNKKKINDGDLSSTFIQSQSKKLPVLFMTTGELTKKAKEMLEKEFKGMQIKKIE